MADTVPPPTAADTLAATPTSDHDVDDALLVRTDQLESLENRCDEDGATRLGGKDAPADFAPGAMAVGSSTSLTPVLYNDLAPLVAMPPPKAAAVTNRLNNQTYSRLGRNLLFEARPAVVHFGGYTLGKAHSQRVRVVNISRTSRRLHVLGPSTDCFKMRCNKKGLVAPGSSEVITVDFHPREHRYHYDCVRLHTDAENLLIPLHAYPVMNDFVFPSRLDFGTHALGETVRRMVKMVCKVPIQFEFEIVITKSHPHFVIGPLRGIVPSNGAAEVHVEHTPSSCCSAEMEILVSVSQFNFKAITCVITGAGKPGIIRQKALEASASRLGKTTLENSLGPSKTLAKAFFNDFQKDSTGSTGLHCDVGDKHDRWKTPGADAGNNLKNDSQNGAGAGIRYGAENSSGMGGLQHEALPDGEFYRGQAEGFREDAGAEESVGSAGANLVDTWSTRPPSAEKRPYHTAVGSGAVFDAGGQWLAIEREKKTTLNTEHRKPWVAPSDGSAFGSLLDGPPKTSVVEGLVIPAKLDTVQATNFVLTQQPGKLKPKDLKEAIRQARRDRVDQLKEQEALRALTASPDNLVHEDTQARQQPPLQAPVLSGDGKTVLDGVLKSANDDRGHNVDPPCSAIVPRAAITGDGGGSKMRQPAQLSGRAICAYERTNALGKGDVGRGNGRDRGAGSGGAVASRQLKEMSFLQDLAAIESEERDRSFKASVEHIGEPRLSNREVKAVLEERRRCEREVGFRRRAVERKCLHTCLKGPTESGQMFARASLLLTGTGTQGIGFQHVPDWDPYKNDDWGKRRAVLRRLVILVGRWVVRRRASRRLAAIRSRLGDLRTRAEVAAMVDHDNNQAKLAAGPRANAASDDRKTGTHTDEVCDGWDFPDPLVTSQALAAEMLAEMEMEEGGWEGTRGSRPRLLHTPPPPEFSFTAEDVHPHRFPMYEEDAVTNRRREALDETGPPMDFIDVALLSLKEPQEGKAMGYEIINPPALGTYPTIENSRALRWSALEECGVRQPRDESEYALEGAAHDAKDSGDGASGDSGKIKGWRKALTSSDRRESQATFGRRRSSVGLRMLPSTTENPAEAWLGAAEAELTELAEYAENVARLPDSLLYRKPPPEGIDLITPDPRFKAFLPERGFDEASPEWCLRPQEIPRKVPVTKGMLLGYSPGSTTLRAYANAPRLYDSWRPTRERRCSGLSCMRGQAFQGVWKPIGVPASAITNHGNRGGEFQLVPEATAAAAATGDQLSDSESEDDEGGYSSPPTLAYARLYFDPSAETLPVNALERDSVDADATINAGANEADGAGGKELRGGVKHLFLREDASAGLERKRREERERDADRLADRMGALAAEVRNVKHAFVLQTPYHRIP